MEEGIIGRVGHRDGRVMYGDESGEGVMGRAVSVVGCHVDD